MELDEEPYRELGVATTASTAEIRAAYVELARRFHPDRHDAVSPDPDRMARINAAWTLLSNARRRAIYDAAHSGAASSGATIRSAGDTWTPLDDDDGDVDLLDDTPSGARPLPRFVALLPVSLFAIGVLLIVVGFIVKVTPGVGIGVALIVASGATFLAIPIVTMIGAVRVERHR